jgi:hypothetical protein
MYINVLHIYICIYIDRYTDIVIIVNNNIITLLNISALDSAHINLPEYQRGEPLYSRFHHRRPPSDFQAQAQSSGSPMTLRR